jgi:hypothetical protein
LRLSGMRTWTAGSVEATTIGASAGRSMRALPASNMLSRLTGPLAVTVSRSGFAERMILIQVGWQ